MSRGATRHSLIMVTFAIALLGVLAASAIGGSRSSRADTDPYATGSFIVSGTIVTMDERLRVLPQGHVYIRDGVIIAIADEADGLPPGAGQVPRVDTRAFVYPGLLNIHDHLAFGALPPWPVPLVADRPLTSAHQWREGGGPYAAVRDEYVSMVLATRSDLIDGGLGAEVGKWAEIKALVAGTTTTQGSFGFDARGQAMDPKDAFRSHLVRNVDLTEAADIRQSALGIYERGPRPQDGPILDERLLESVLDDIDDGVVEGFLVHLSEGTAEASRRELYDLNDFGRDPDEACGPLMAHSVVIHGTAYGRRELDLLARCGTDLVVSLLGNLRFYGQAPDLALAMEAGVKVSLSTDWSPVGAKNLLVALKVADFLDRRIHGDHIPDVALVRMVTTNPADSVGWGTRAGRLQAGAWGDLLVVRSSLEDPYRALIEATERDVALVAVGGEPLYGDPGLMRALKPVDHEMVDSGCGFDKAIDVTTTRPDVADGDATLRDIQASLRAAFRELALERDIDGPTPLFMCADRAQIDVLRASRTVGHLDSRIAELDEWLEGYYVDSAWSPSRVERTSKTRHRRTVVGPGTSGGALGVSLRSIARDPGP